MITDVQIRDLLAFAHTGRQTDRKRMLRDNCIKALEGSAPHRQWCLQEHLRVERIRAVIKEFFRDKPPGTTIADQDLAAYRLRLQEAARVTFQLEEAP